MRDSFTTNTARTTRWSRAFFFAALFGLAFICGTDQAVAQIGTIEGRVVDAERGSAIPGASVALQGTTRGDATDANGDFRIVNVPAGSYTVAVTVIGFQTAREQVTVGAGETVRVDVELLTSQLDLGEIVVSIARTGTSASALPIKVDVIEPREVEQQKLFAANPVELLANTIPSFAPSRQKLTGFGESFRGRRPLYLVDGVPQSNPLRDGSRDGFTIDTEVVESVEVVFGANAIQGLGATGGIINYVTASPPAGDDLEQEVAVTTSTADGFEDDGFGYRGYYQVGKRVGDFDVLASVSYEQRGLLYDGDNQAIGVDNVQGDIANSQARNFFVKAGWTPSPAQRLQLMVNDFQLSQDGEFVTVPGDIEAGVPAIAEAGDPDGDQPVNNVTTAALTYEHTNIGGGTLSASAYYQDFAALFGGGVFGVFQDPTIAPNGELFDQSENNSEKFGTRLTYTRQNIGNSPVDVVAGFDFLRDKTFQALAQTDRNWVPETQFFNYAPFVQLEVQPVELVTISGGFRYELATLDVDDYESIAGNRRSSDFQLTPVAGGSPSFNEPLLNIGGVISPIQGLRFYGSYAEAFTMPDVGRVLRGVNVDGVDIDDFLEIDPIVTDNIEFGASYATRQALLEVTYFESDSDFGARLVADEDGIFRVARQATQTSGWEVSGRIEPLPILALGAAYSSLTGTFDGDDDGEFESDLGSTEIGPDRLNLLAEINPGGQFSGRLQAFTFFDRDFLNGADEVVADFDGYTLVDASAAAQFGPTTLTLAISNLLNEQFITYYSQTATTRGDRFFAGRGRTLTLRIGTRF
ncbi:MAG: TonB-dependent receptor [Bacteroidota bacterium]